MGCELQNPCFYLSFSFQPNSFGSALGRCKEEGKIIKACKFMEKVFDVSTIEISIPQIKEISGEFENYSLSFIQYLEIVAHHAVLLQ